MLLRFDQPNVAIHMFICCPYP